MDPLVYQLLLDQAQVVERLRGSHAEADELLRLSIVRTFEAVLTRRSELREKDWKQLADVLRELADVMLDDQFVISSICFPTGRRDVDLRPFLKEIREKSH